MELNLKSLIGAEELTAKDTVGLRRRRALILQGGRLRPGAGGRLVCGRYPGRGQVYGHTPGHPRRGGHHPAWSS